MTLTDDEAVALGKTWRRRAMTLTDDEVRAEIEIAYRAHYGTRGRWRLTVVDFVFARHFYALGLTAERSQRAAHVRAYAAGLAAIPHKPAFGLCPICRREDCPASWDKP